MAMPRLLERYRNDVVPAMMKEFEYDNVMRVPRVQKIVLNIGMGEALQNAKNLRRATTPRLLWYCLPFRLFKCSRISVES